MNVDSRVGLMTGGSTGMIGTTGGFVGGTVGACVGGGVTLAANEETASGTETVSQGNRPISCGKIMWWTLRSLDTS